MFGFIAKLFGFKSEVKPQNSREIIGLWREIYEVPSVDLPKLDYLSDHWATTVDALFECEFEKAIAMCRKTFKLSRDRAIRAIHEHVSVVERKLVTSVPVSYFGDIW